MGKSKTTANAFVVIDKSTASGAVYIGPFATQEEAEQHAAEHQSEKPGDTLEVTTLVAPANC
jgi:hypothetical protein